MNGRPAWLLALVFAIAVAGVVGLEALGHSEGAQRVIGMTVPILTALYIADRLDRRSDTQDETLSLHTTKLGEVSKAVNGDLTRRLDEATAPLAAELAALREEQTRVANALAANASTATVAVTATVLE